MDTCSRLDEPAVLPLALLWFGLGVSSIVFVMVQSVVWAVYLNTITGFQTVRRRSAWPDKISVCAE